MNEENHLSSFANDYGNFTSIQQLPDYRHPQPNSANMADVGSTIFVTCSALAVAFAVRKTLRTQEFKRQRADFKRLPIVARAAFVSLLVAVIAYGGAKPGTNYLETISRPLVALMGVGEQLESIPEAVSLTENQQLAGFALTAVVTNETFDLSAPSNAVVHSNWLKRGAAEDGFWAPVGAFCLRTNRYDSVYVSSSGILSFNHPKSSPLALMMPDGSPIAFLAPLQTVLGIPPESRWNLLSATNSLFWYDMTDSGSARFTWQNVLLGRATNAPLSFQAELFPSGDFIYRYDFSSLTSNPLPLTPAFVIGAQNNGGGETALIATDTHSCSGTNHLCASLYHLDGTNILITPLCSVATNSPKFSLHWTAFGDFNPSNPDPDDDGVTTSDEVLLYHTNPNMPDSDLDGIADGTEVLDGFNPLLRDTDGDGLVDGSDPDPLSSTSLDDLDGDGIPDAYEVFMFSSTNAVGSLTYDPSGTGFPLSTKIAAGMNPNALPATETIPTNNLASLKLFDGFRCDFTNTPNIIYSRTIDIDRNNGWQQYFLSSASDRAKGWNLQGMTLEWEDSAGGSGTATASPLDDSLYLPVSTNSPETLTLTLRTTSTNSISSLPLYLLTWSPSIESAGTAQATIDGSVCYAVEWEDEGGSVGISYDLSNRPCHAEPSELELAPRLNPFPEESRLVFTPNGNATGGSLSPKAPGAFAIPKAIKIAEAEAPSSRLLGGTSLMSTASTSGSGNGGGVIIFFDPHMTYGEGHSGGCASVLLFNSETGTYSETYEYPLDSGCLWKNWHRDTTGAYSCTCEAKITYGDESLKDWFTEDIEYDVPGVHATGTILFGGNAIWDGEAWHYTADDCSEKGVKLLSSDGCDSCSSGCANGNCDDLEGDSLGSLAFRIPLGTPRDSQISGFLWFKSDAPLMITPAIFNLLVRDDANVTSVTNQGAFGSGISLVTCSDERGRTATITTNIAHGVRITMTKTADNSLEHTWEITNVNGNPNEIQIRKISRLNNIMHDVTYTYDPVGDWPDQPEWIVFDNIAQSSEILKRSDGLNDPHSGILYEEHIVRNADNDVLSHTETESRRYGFGENAVIREIYHSVLATGLQGGVDWINDYATYWEDNENSRFNGRPRLTCGESRAWQYQTWDERGHETLRLDQWDGSYLSYTELNNNTPKTISTLSSLVTATATVSDYTPLDGDSDHKDDLDAVRTESRYLVRSGIPTLISKTWHVYTHCTDSVGRATATVQTIRSCSQEAQIGDAGNAVSSYTSFDDDAEDIPLLLHGRSISSTDEDGLTTTYNYTFGEYNPATRVFTTGGAETFLRTLVSTSTAAAPNGIPGKSTQSLTIQDATHGTTLYTSTLLGTGGSSGPPLSWQSNSYDDKNRLRFTLYSDGSSATNAYSCCRLLWTIDRNGAITLRSAETGKDHLYYAIEEISLRDITEDHPDYSAPGHDFRVTQHFMDALGRETNTVVKTSLNEGSATTPDFSAPAIPCFTDTTLYPYGTSDYSVQTDRRGIRTLSSRLPTEQLEISVTQTFEPSNYVTPSTVSTNIWYRNGHSISERYWGSQWTRESQFTDYTQDGTLIDISVTDASDYVAPVTNRVSFSDFLGRTIYSVTPMGTISNTYDGATSKLLATTSFTPSTSSTTTYLYDDIGNQAGTVRNGITDASETCYEAISNEIWRVTTQWQFADGETNGSSVVRSQMTGLSNSLRSRTVATSANGMTSVSTASFDPETKILTTTKQTGNATPSIIKSKYGIVIETQNRSARTVYYYDAFLLPYYVWTFKPGGELLTRQYMEEIDDETWQPLRTSTRLGETSNYIYEDVTYDAYGQIQTQTDDLGNSTTNSYDLLQRLDGISGATYPVGYGYDTMGRMKELRTTRNGSTFDETRWLFNQITGLVTNKLYADDSAIAYAYTDDGKPHRTTWARGVWRENAYDSRDLLAGVSYSDNTPSIDYAYNVFGSLTNVLDETGRNTVYLLNARQTVTNETVAVGTSSFTINRFVDGHERPLMKELSVNGTNKWLTAYSYDNENNIRSVSCTNSAGRAFTVDYTNDYGYALGYKVILPQGDAFTRTVQRDPYRRYLITSCSQSFNGTPLKSTAYSFDTLNRATRRIDGGTVTNTFGYNARSEVSSASILSNAYTFAYDFIGNHTTSSVDSVTTTYLANSINQYSQISVPSVPSVENLSYDLDGNMLTNGVFSYTYDAENRLATTCSNSVCVVSNAYDYMNRRIRKVTPSVTTTFVYDGWNLIHETIATTNSSVSEIQYFWGVDLSGSPQGAGGVGGLLAVSISGSFYFPLQDNNGNITAYVDESGTVVAEYAYDAFGETIAQSGSMADTFRFRFSTKYYDTETGLYYYGMRFYSPDLLRWINRDPIGEKGGFGLYGFCGNDGVNQVDSLGETPITTDVWWETYDRTIIVVEAFKKTGDFLWASELKSSGRGPVAKVKPCDLFLVFVNVPRDDSDDEQAEEFPLVSSQDTGVYKNRGDHNVVPRRTYSKGGRSYTKLWDSLPAQMPLNALANPINVVYKDGKLYRYKENDQMYIHSVKGKDLKKTSQVTVWVDIMDAKGNLSQKHTETIKIEVSR